jgi:hypothetical protein
VQMLHQVNRRRGLGGLPRGRGVGIVTAAALKLDKGTQLDRMRKSVVVRDYGDGVIEVGISNVPGPNQLEVDHRTSASDREDPEKDKANLERSMRRSKANIRRKCMAAGLNYLLTLTYRDNRQDLESCFEDLARFVRLVRKTNKSWKYVAVAEFQKRGAVHFHLAVQGWQNVQYLRHCWHTAIKSTDGNIQVKAPRNKLGNAWHFAKLAGYLTKYISKELCQFATGRQRYRVSEGIEVPRKRFIIEFPVGSDWLQEIFDTFGSDISYRHESPMGWSWACSW